MVWIAVKSLIMIIKSRWSLTFLSSVLLVASLSIWLLFAPMKLGGQVDYIIITGNSMEPRVHQNDLIVVRKSDEYHVGDAVAYRNSDINRIVFHRIISGNSLHYIMQGDNNGWVDSYTPSASEIVGKEWLFFPGAGKTFAWLKQPLNATLFAGIFGGSIMGFELFKKKKKKGSTPYPPLESTENRSSTIRDFPVQASSAAGSGSFSSQPAKKPSSLNLQVELGFLVLGVIALASLIMFLVSFAKPVTRITNPEYPYTQSIKYEYDAPAPVGVYDSQALAAGDPVFTNLTCQINLLATYQFSGLDFTGLSGTHRLEAVVSEPVSGWKRSFPLESEQSFSGDSFSSLVKVDFCQFKAAISKMEEQTGSTSYTYNISIEPNVLQTGEIHGNQFLASFNSELPFQMDATRAFILRETAETNPLDQSKEGVQTTQQSVRNKIKLLSLNLDVVATRIISSLTLILSLVGLWLIFDQISKASKKDKGLMVKLKYGGALINVENPPQVNPRTSVNLTEIDDLAKIAEKQGTVIFHHEVDGQHSYFVEANGMTYVCSLPKEGEVQAPPLISMAAPSILQQALTKGEFTVYYQPMISLRDKKIEGIEALLRWNHPQTGLLAADNFIREAEITGDILPIGEYTRSLILAQAKAWQQKYRDIFFSINLSETEMVALSIESLKVQLALNGLDPKSCQVEVTQKSALNPSVKMKLAALHHAGFLTALENDKDEINLKLLEDLPIDKLKLDRTILAGLTQSRDLDSIRKLVEDCTNRGILVCADGLETRAEVNLVRSLSFSCGQGNGICPPSSVVQMDDFIKHASHL